MMPNSDPEGQIFLSAPNKQNKILFLAYFLISSDSFLGVTIDDSHSCMLTSAILEVDVKCDVTMTSVSSILETDLRDLYNQCIDSLCCYLFFIYPRKGYVIYQQWLKSQKKTLSGMQEITCM